MSHPDNATVTESTCSESTGVVQPSFFAQAQGFSIENQYNVGQATFVSADTSGPLRALNPILDASYARNRKTSPPDSQCLPGTRKDMLRKVITWVDSSVLLNRKHIMWLYGSVGCGKSAIAQAVAEEYAEKKRLAASHFFFRGSGDRNKSHRFAATIAAQVAAAIPSTERLIEEAATKQIGLLEPGTSLRAQFQRLVLDPVRVVQWGGFGFDLLRRPFLIVLDGLDECEDREEIAELIDCIVEFFAKNRRIPLRFLITSRVEEHLRTRLDSDHVSLVNLVDHTSMKDIEIALRAAFALAAKHDRAIQAYGKWPSEENLGQLIRHIGTSFIFMSTISKFILSPADDGLSPIQRLPLALNIDPGLDGLYTQTLSRSRHLPHFSDIIRTIALSQSPLSILGLANFLGIQTYEVVQVLINLHAILHVPGDDITPVTVHHKSLRDFLETHNRSGDLHVSHSYHRYMAYRGLAIAGDLATRNSPAFDYAEKYWGVHLSMYILTLPGRGNHYEESGRIARNQEARALLTHLRQIFPANFDLLFGVCILLNEKYIKRGEEAINGTQAHSSIFPKRMDFGFGNEYQSTIAFLLQDEVPPFKSRIVFESLARLGYRIWESRRELQALWVDLDPPLPPLESIYDDLVALGQSQLIQYFAPEIGPDGPPLSLSVQLTYRPHPVSESYMAFCLTIMSWAEQLSALISFVKDRNDRPGRPAYREREPYYCGVPVPIAQTPVVWHLLQWLLDAPTKARKADFIKTIQNAVQNCEAIEDLHAFANVGVLSEAVKLSDLMGMTRIPENYISDLEKDWKWSRGKAGWNFHSVSEKRPSTFHLLAGLSALTKCLERQCEPLHGPLCHVRDYSPRL